MAKKKVETILLLFWKAKKRVKLITFLIFCDVCEQKTCIHNTDKIIIMFLEINGDSQTSSSEKQSQVDSSLYL